jgi:HK97 family phage prohead protease
MNELMRAAQKRAASAVAPADRPSRRRCAADVAAPPLARAALTRMEFREVMHNGQAMLQFDGYANVTERGYEMWDWAGPYTEVVDAAAPSIALASNPDVAFLINHGGMTLARTKSGTMTLGADNEGQSVRAFLDPRHSDVANLRIAMERGDVDEMSFAFVIVRGQWSPDYMEYRILEYDIDRGDVSVVNYGANPFTSASLRGKSAVKDGMLSRLAAGALTDTDVTALTALLSQLAAADAAFDPVVDALNGADMALDAGQLVLSMLLGVPNPDADAALSAGKPLLERLDKAGLRLLEQQLRAAMRRNGLVPLPTFEDVH